jgi:unsaturated chondroitin disaccharide hydrolase
VGTDALRDSSSAAIAVCGLLELVKHLPVTDPDRERYQQWAMGICRR